MQILEWSRPFLTPQTCQEPHRKILVVVSPLLASSGSLALALRRHPHALAAPRLAVRPHMTVRVGASDEAVAELDERYLSVCLDLGQVAEPTRFWNPDGSGEVVGLPSFDFERRKILNMSRALAPAYLRIGASRC